jgi:oxygen-independent coproporphyrinogen-3 oxidase
VHIPFCEQLCYYCACNKIITKHHERAAPYLDALEAELALVVASLGTDRPVSQLHFGGGSPTFLADDELARLMQAIAATFPLTPRLRGLDRGRPAHRHARAAGALCAPSGFNRLSFGVQDFDPDVQRRCTASSRSRWCAS